MSMTDIEMQEWGRNESKLRQSDLALDRSPAGLVIAQKNAEHRRKVAGLTRNQAANLVIQANREIRRNAQS